MTLELTTILPKFDYLIDSTNYLVRHGAQANRSCPVVHLASLNQNLATPVRSVGSTFDTASRNL
jgi:hypothetical protein